MSARSRLAGPALFTLAWSVAARFEFVNPALLPGPFAVAAEFVRLCRGPLLPDLGASMARVLVALVFAFAIGVPLGVLIGSVPALYSTLELPIDLGRSVPAVAMIPLVVVLLGVGETAKLTVAVWPVALVLAVNTSYGMRGIGAARRRLARSLGMTRLQMLRLIALPEATPHVFAGLRIGVSAAMTVVVATEMFIGTRYGLGRRIYEAQLLFRIPELYATTFVAGLSGYLLNKLVVLTERRALHWVGQ